MNTSTLDRAAPSVAEHKSLFGAGTKVLSEDEGVVEAIVSVTGIVDEVKDIIVPGAYAKTLAARLPKGVFHHAWEQPIAKALDVKELLPGDPALPKRTARGEAWPADAGAVMVKVQFNLATQRGREAYEDVKFFGDEQEWSIGYNVPRGGSRLDHKKGIRLIDTLDWYEFSPVLFGAMPLAGTTSIKSAGGMIIGGVGVERKALPGSYEELRHELHEAVQAALLPNGDSGGVEIRATFPDRVVVCHYHDREEDEWEYPYTWDGESVTLGDRTAVKIVETVVADTDEADETPAEAPSEETLDTKAKGGVDKNRGDAEKLRHYWVHGEGAAKIQWGVPGDFTRCVALLSKHMGERAKGYCQLRHHDALGVYAGQEHGKAATVPLEFADATSLLALEAKVWAEIESEEKRKFDTGQREQMAEHGTAMPDGSYPIANRDDLRNAIQAFGRASNPDAVKRHIIKRARALNALDALPDSWKVEKSIDDDVETKSITDLIIDGPDMDTLSPRELVENAILRSAT